MKSLAIFAVITFSLVSCIQTGQVSSYIVVADGTDYVRMGFTNISGNNELLLSLHALDTSIVLEIGVYGLAEIGPGGELEIQVDSQQYFLPAMSTETQQSLSQFGMRVSAKGFSTTKTFLKAVVDAKDVWIRVNTTSGFIEEKMSRRGPNSPRGSIKEFLQAAKRL